MTPGTGTAASLAAFPELQDASPSSRDLIVEVSDVSLPSAPSEAWNWAWLLWQRRHWLGRALACGLALSAAMAFLLPKRYQSTTRLMPPDGQPGSGLALLAAMAGKGSFGASSLAGNLLGQRSTGALFVDILRGRTVEDRIVSRFDLRKVYGKRYWIDARKRLSARTEIEEDRKSEVITIRVTDRDPGRAAAIAQAYVDELDHLVAEVSTSSARRERIFIEARLKNVKRELDEASRQFSEYASRNATIDLSTQGKAMVEAAGRLQGELIASQSELAGLEQIYAPNNARVRSLRARIEELKKQLDKLGGSPAGGSTALADAGPIASEASGADFPSIRQLPLLGVRWAELYRQTKIEETVYELLTQQYELAKIEEAKEIPTVKILDAADVPERKSWPPRLAIILLGTTLATSAAGLWILGVALWQQIDPQDPRKRLCSEVVHQVRTACRRPLTRRLAMLAGKRSSLGGAAFETEQSSGKHGS